MKYFLVSTRRVFENLVFLILDFPFFFEPPMNRFKNRIMNVFFGSHISDEALLLNGVRILFPKNFSIGRSSYISYGTIIEARERISIGDNVTISPEVFISTGDHSVKDLSGLTAPIRIEDGVFIGARAMILSGVTVGAHSIVGAGAVVVKDVPSFTVVAGVPSKVIKTRENVNRVWTVFGAHDLAKDAV